MSQQLIIVFGSMKSGKSGIQYRNSEATGLGYSLVMKKNEIAQWRQVKRSTVESCTAARQLNTLKVLQSPRVKVKTELKTQIVYLLLVLYYEQPIVSGTPTFRAERRTAVHTAQAIGTQNLRSSDTNKRHPIQNRLSY